MDSRASAHTGGAPRRRPAALLTLIALFAAGYLIRAGVSDLGGLLGQIGVDPAAVGLATTPSPAASSATEEGTIAVFFTTPNLVYPDVARNRAAPPAERALLADINAANRSVDVALYEYNLAGLAEALVRAEGRGVEVRAALDRENLDSAPMAEWAGAIEEAGAAVTWERSDAFMHSKFVIVDGRLVWTGSWNATVNDTYRNNNNLLRITVPAIVENYRAEFTSFAEERFGNDKLIKAPHPLARFGGGTIETYFTPRDRANATIAGWIDRSRRGVDFLAFSFTADEIADAMIRRQRAGLPVRGVFERRNATGIGSEFERLRDAGVAAEIDGNCYTMHHKVIVIDGRIVITGSYNFTGRAEELNDENLLIIDDPVIARAFQQEFERVYARARNPTRCE